LACSATLTTTGAIWVRGSASRCWNNGCFSVKDEDDDDDKDDDQDTKKQHSIRWGHFVETQASPHPTGDASVPRTPSLWEREQNHKTFNEEVYRYGPTPMEGGVGALCASTLSA
jgi:hypothetical protein